MLPIGSLMREHRLIERMVENLRKEKELIQHGELNTVFVDETVDFFRTYADRTHHGKEEDILFRELAEKKLTPEHKQIMDELTQEHIAARKTVKELNEAKERYLRGDRSSLKDIESDLATLISLYPTHIEKEDKRFFYPIMDYFTDVEKDAMLGEFYEFDRNIIHEKYGGLVDGIRSQTRETSMMRCTVCGYVYDVAKGDPEHGLKAGTLFQELPDDWVCPVCFASKSLFEKMKS
jgi:hemerythrin-like domain-containing protein/rubredoxin